MPRIAYDCTSGAAQWVHDNLPVPDVMFWYGTGSPGIQWNDAEKALFPHSVLVEIDQGGAGTPVPSAQVRDVESGAWAPGQAVSKAGWTAERPTIYCNRSTLPSVAADGWQGDVWLAWPGWAGETLPSYPGITIVAVQDEFHADYDHTTILDQAWPGAAVTPPSQGSLSVTVESRSGALAFTTSLSPDHVVIEYTPPNRSGSVVLTRVADVVPGKAYHVNLTYIPGVFGGKISAFAIVHGKSLLIGSRDL